MKAAVSYLEPLMDRVEGAARGTMVLATVKGDVHDIGKNLVDIILTNNGYRVINLGIKQPIENIISAAIENKADCIGMSGLLVKSTVIMKENLDVLNERGITMPVILGGAALTRRYVEEDCRRVYKGRLFYAQDAFDDLKIMGTLAAGEHIEPAPISTSKDETLATPITAISQRAGGRTGNNGDENIAELDPVRSDVQRGLPIPKPPFWGTRIVDDFDLNEVFDHINENALIRGQWRVRKGDMSQNDYDQLLAEKVHPALASIKKKCIIDRLLLPKAVYGYFPCQSAGNDLIVFKEDHKTEWLRFHFPRQDHGRHLCISDFFSSIDEGRMDVIPIQIATVGEIATAHAQKLFAQNEYTEYLYFHGLSVESAEAVAEIVHKRIRAELGFAHKDAVDRNKLFQQGYQGTRYSFGYPACPNLEDQQQSTSAIVVIHPEAKYFNIAATPAHIESDD
jgi:5-methyltetrahydrofolate--homocysteine methyltransferase